jgi:hypothetical protein
VEHTENTLGCSNKLPASAHHAHVEMEHAGGQHDPNVPGRVRDSSWVSLAQTQVEVGMQPPSTPPARIVVLNPDESLSVGTDYTRLPKEEPQGAETRPPAGSEARTQQEAADIAGARALREGSIARFAAWAETAAQ